MSPEEDDSFQDEMPDIPEHLQQKWNSEESRPETSRQCPHCGQSVPAERLMCLYCGESLGVRAGFLSSLKSAASAGGGLPVFLILILAALLAWQYGG